MDTLVFLCTSHYASAADSASLAVAIKAMALESSVVKIVILFFLFFFFLLNANSDFCSDTTHLSFSGKYLSCLLQYLDLYLT